MKNEKLWFRAKLFGWGWRPVSWEGWIITLLYVCELLSITTKANKQHSVSDALFSFAVPFVIMTIFFLTICYLKGERPRWRWGK